MPLDLVDSPESWHQDDEWIREQYPRLSAMPRWATKRNLDRPTLGRDVAAVATELGTPFMPWQDLVADVAYELDPDGKLHYSVITVTIHRQGGKTTLILPVEVHRCVAWKSRQRVVYTAQNRSSSRAKLIEDQMPMIRDSALGQYGHPRLSNGSEAWMWNNGSQIGLMSNTKRAGHGFTNDLVVSDEAFAQTDWRIEQSLRPTMITRDETQWWTVSTAGDETSVYLLEKVRAGRHLVESGEDKRIAYFEWSIPLDADMDDPETYRRYLPAVGTTISIEDLMVERSVLPDMEFRRAFGNQWTEGLHSVDAVIPPKHWDAMADVESKVDPSKHLRLTVDVSPGQEFTSLAVAGTRLDGVEHLEAIETKAGMDWAVDRIVEVIRNNPMFDDLVTLDLSTPAGALVPALTDAGLEVAAVSGRDWNAACASFYAASLAREYRHVDDPELNKAVAAAGKTETLAGWHWKRRGSDPITPLCAVTLAHWALLTADLSDDYDPLDSFI